MNEKKYVNRVRELLSEAKELEKYTITAYECLIYNVIIIDGVYTPKEPMMPKKNNYAYETDLLIKKGDTPLVVIEVKTDTLSTHDILVYSSKALAHKSIYPYLRYGLLAGGKNFIPKRFFIHNTGFDFAMSMNEYEDIASLVFIIEEQISVAKMLLKILTGKKKIKHYQSIKKRGEK
ncbi:MAG: hypothetical protein ACFFDN_42690 [Candidatus Hodarchaeota archaeon]